MSPITATPPTQRKAQPRQRAIPRAQAPDVTTNPRGDDKSDQNPKPFQRRLDWGSFLVSFIVHLNVMLLLAVTFRYWPAEEPEPLVIESALLGEETDNALDDAPIEELELPPSEEIFADAGALSAEMLVRPTVNDDWAGPGDLSGGLNLGGGGLGGGAGFFGTRAVGKSFVFVVDCSGSMKGLRFMRATAELRRSLEDLSSTQQFQVIFFNQTAHPWIHPLHRGKLLDATPKIISQTISWIGKRDAAGGTRPDGALSRALRLKPDVVFFLTDADQIPRNVRNLVEEQNKHGATVHTIAFGNRGGEALMQGIAKDHHGRYRYVP